MSRRRTPLNLLTFVSPAFLAPLRTLKPDDHIKLQDEADALVASHGDDAIDLIRGRIAQADRAARRQLYRLHDELARRRRDYGQDALSA